MIIVGEALVSEDILENHFVCNLNKCHGACCISGDRGAPLQQQELEIIEKALPEIKIQMDIDGLNLLANQGFYETDPSDGELVTTCRDGGACVFVVLENGTTQCAIEKAFKAGAIDYKKPISCHLYPIRAAQYGDYTVLNYNRWDICNPACSHGLEQNTKLYQFLKEPLIRKFGDDWYKELEEIGDTWNNRDMGQ